MTPSGSSVRPYLRGWPRAKSFHANPALIRIPQSRKCTRRNLVQFSKGRIFVTGKLWPKLFHIQVVPGPRK
ncbi:MAG: glutaminyl-peptide cyclotransferase [Acidobacteria bacterium]|nr:glutaminyl-peptide cyclotransferase [Acidobacteriota bacterium]